MFETTNVFLHFPGLKLLETQRVFNGLNVFKVRINKEKVSKIDKISIHNSHFPKNRTSKDIDIFHSILSQIFFKKQHLYYIGVINA